MVALKCRCGPLNVVDLIPESRITKKQLEQEEQQKLQRTERTQTNGNNCSNQQLHEAMFVCVTLYIQGSRYV